MVMDEGRGMLMDEAVTPESSATPQDVANGAVSLGHNLKSFTDSLHEKSSVMTGWIATVDALVNGKPGEREVKRLDWKCF